MLDPRLLRADPERLVNALAKRGVTLDLNTLIELDNQRKSLQQETEKLQNERNLRAKSMGQAKASGQDMAPLLAEVNDLGDRLDAAKASLAHLTRSSSWIS
jgi:seryl-tRNA synthetase